MAQVHQRQTTHRHQLVTGRQVLIHRFSGQLVVEVAVGPIIMVVRLAMAVHMVAVAVGQNTVPGPDRRVKPATQLQEQIEAVAVAAVAGIRTQEGRVVAVKL
jgi:hypothetical protein|tara:strand:+ start:343 stop:648 length:306 start_codon:yes stop_codon:yes gene_type:complete